VILHTRKKQFENAGVLFFSAAKHKIDHTK